MMTKKQKVEAMQFNKIFDSLDEIALPWTANDSRNYMKEVFFRDHDDNLTSAYATNGFCAVKYTRERFDHGSYERFGDEEESITAQQERTIFNLENNFFKSSKYPEYSGNILLPCEEVDMYQNPTFFPRVYFLAPDELKISLNHQYISFESALKVFKLLDDFAGGASIVIRQSSEPSDPLYIKRGQFEAMIMPCLLRHKNIESPTHWDMTRGKWVQTFEDKPYVMRGAA